MSNLLPCPFCGGVAEVWGQGIDWVVKCVKCNAKSTWTYTEAEAIEAWNRRPQQVEDYRYHVDCDDRTHGCSTCKHNEDCTFNCSTRNVNSAVCFYEQDDDFATYIAGYCRFNRNG